MTSVSDAAPQVVVVPASKPAAAMADEVLAGLEQSVRELHPKYFYDERGSILFDQICDTPEYYPTRTETRLLSRHAESIIATAAPDHLLELGSGASRKSRLLLDHWHGKGNTYWPFDVSVEMLQTVAHDIHADYPDLTVRPLAGDYTAGLDGLPGFDRPVLWVFLGSTLGNFSRADALEFVTDIARQMKPGDHFLLGADLHKDPQVLEAAYNDAQGLTAQFNRNILEVVNQRLGSDFNPGQFRHKAIYNQARRQIEMYLVSLEDQQVRFPQQSRAFRFAAGEAMLTEISRKFLPDELCELYRAAGLETPELAVDEAFPYALCLGAQKR